MLLDNFLCLLSAARAHMSSRPHQSGTHAHLRPQLQASDKTNAYSSSPSVQLSVVDKFFVEEIWRTCGKKEARHWIRQETEFLLGSSDSASTFSCDSIGSSAGLFSMNYERSGLSTLSWQSQESAALSSSSTVVACRGAQDEVRGTKETKDSQDVPTSSAGLHFLLKGVIECGSHYWNVELRKVDVHTKKAKDASSQDSEDPMASTPPSLPCDDAQLQEAEDPLALPPLGFVSSRRSDSTFSEEDPFDCPPDGFTLPFSRSTVKADEFDRRGLLYTDAAHLVRQPSGIPPA